MFHWLKRQFAGVSSPVLDWVQVEVTTYCNAACIYCPHTLLGDRWIHKHMPLELFKELLPYLRNTDLVFLQGWGEPLLNKNLPEMVRLTKDQGNHVGFTTNGLLLNEVSIQQILEMEPDILGISLAGTKPETHNRIRQGTDFDTLVSRIESLQKRKHQKGMDRPSLHLAYLLLKSTWDELKDIVPLARRLGAQEIVASHLSLVLSPRLAREALFHDSENRERYADFLQEVENRAAREGIVFSWTMPDLDETSSRCSENVHRSCVISVEGEVVPCVFGNPVLCGKGEEKTTPSPEYLFCGLSCPFTQITFGNISHETLTCIWNKPAYAAFRQRFDPESAVRCVENPLDGLPLSCQHCYKRLLSTSDSKGDSERITRA